MSLNSGRDAGLGSLSFLTSLSLFCPKDDSPGDICAQSVSPVKSYCVPYSQFCVCPSVDMVIVYFLFPKQDLGLVY